MADIQKRVTASGTKWDVRGRGELVFLEPEQIMDLAREVTRPPARYRRGERRVDRYPEYGLFVRFAAFTGLRCRRTRRAARQRPATAAPSCARPSVGVGGVRTTPVVVLAFNAETSVSGTVELREADEGHPRRVVVVKDDVIVGYIRSEHHDDINRLRATGVPLVISRADQQAIRIRIDDPTARSAWFSPV